MNKAAQKLMRDRALPILREKLAVAKALSEAASQADVARKEASAMALSLLVDMDGINGNGVRFEHEGKELAAFACQPKSEKFWDGAPLIEWLKENNLWDLVSVTTLDPAKLEAEIAAGNIKREDVEKFQVTGDPKAVSVKWINPKPDSQ